jgi:isopentenyl phosphate kinase
MRGKLLELLDLADLGIDSMIFNAGMKGNIARVLLGECVGTRIGRAN